MFAPQSLEGTHGTEVNSWASLAVTIQSPRIARIETGETVLSWDSLNTEGCLCSMNVAFCLRNSDRFASFAAVIGWIPPSLVRSAGPSLTLTQPRTFIQLTSSMPRAKF